MRHNAKLTTWLPWLGVLLITLAAAMPLWGNTPYGDDIRLHFFRIPLLSALWQHGVWFARWQPTLNFGYGSPLFNFYPPLSAYALTAVYHLSGQTAAIALNLLFASALLLSCAGMFLLGRQLYGPAGGLLAAALYTWAPHLVYQTYARGSSSNALALAFFPWAAWALLRVGQRPSRNRTILAASFSALLLLSHTAASLLFLGPLFLWGLTAVLKPNIDWATAKPQLRALLLAFLLGLGLSAFSWLPALTEIQETRYHLEASKVNYQENFADIWRWPQPTIAQAHNPVLPKSSGLAQISLGLLGTALAIVSLGQWRKKQDDFPALDWLTAVAGMIGLGTLFLATAWSDPIWELLPALQGLQFPWRLLDIPLFFLALAAGRILLSPPAKWRPAVALLGLILAFANMIPYLYPPRIALPSHPSLADVTAVQQQYGIFGLTAWGEYSNGAIQTWPRELPFPGADEFIPLTQKSIEPPAGFTAVSGDPWQATWQSKLTDAATITLAVHDFPGWQARLDGNPLPVNSDDNGRIQLLIPAGEHTVELAFRRTPVRWLADLLTLASVIIVALGLLLGWRQRHGRAPSSANIPPSPGWLITTLVLLITVLLLLKIVWLDRVDNPLVVQVRDGRVAHFTAPADGNFGDQIQLIGSQLAAPDKLVLLWQAQQANLPRYQIDLTLLDALGSPLQTIHNDTPGYTVTSNWEAGQLIRDEISWPLASLEAPLAYSLSLSIIDPETGNALPLANAAGQTAVSLNRLKIAPPALKVDETIGTQFGSGIKLRQADIPSQLTAGAPLEFTLYWESLAPVDQDVTVFIHLLNAAGSLAAGQDAQPLNGRYPTSFWKPGEIIVDGRQWQPNLPPGHYQLQVGLYHLETGVRLPVSGPAAELGDRLILQEIDIVP